MHEENFLTGQLGQARIWKASKKEDAPDSQSEKLLERRKAEVVKERWREKFEEKTVVVKRRCNTNVTCG